MRIKILLANKIDDVKRGGPSVSVTMTKFSKNSLDMPPYRASELILIDIFLLKIPISIQIKSKSNANQIKSIFYSSFFLCFQGQPELCGNYHLIQSSFSFFVRLHGQPEPFGSCGLALLSSSVSMATLSCMLATTFSSLSFLFNSLSSHRFNLLWVASRCFLWSTVPDDCYFPLVLFWFSFLLFLVRVLQSVFLSSVLQPLKLCLH